MSEDKPDFSHTPADVTRRYQDVLKANIDNPDIIAQLSTYQRRIFATRAIIHWEVCKLVADLPGDIIECGVFKGESLLTFARYLEMLCPGDRSKRVIGFDDFEGLRDLTEHDSRVAAVGSIEGGYRATGFYPTLRALIDLFHEDSFVPKKARIELVEGDLRETAKDYVENEPGLRVSLLHLDVDTYEPTLAALEAFYPRLVTGGVVLMDEYALTAFAGETKAVDDYFDGRPPRIHKLPYNSSPGGYFIKE